VTAKSGYGALALATGGVDSTTMLYDLAAQEVAARVLYIDFGSPAAPRETAAVKLIAHRLGLPLDILDASGFAALQLGYLWPSLVSGPELDVGRPAVAEFEIARSDSRMTSGFGVIAAVGLYTAALLDIPSVSLGIVREQFAIFPGLAAGLRGAEQLSRAVNPGIEVALATPLSQQSKATVVKRAVELGVPLHMTWSCAYGGEKPCGRCERCRARDAAVAEAGAKLTAGPAIDPPAALDMPATGRKAGRKQS
jgi:7-cyano-7-deazaguanine synthase